MNHMSGTNRKLNQTDGRQIVDYINKRIKEKADMERMGLPFFKADSAAFESQDIKRLTILDKVFKTRVTQFKHKRVKEFKMTKSHKPIWWQLTNFIKKEKKVGKFDTIIEEIPGPGEDEDDELNEEPFNFKFKQNVMNI